MSLAVLKSSSEDRQFESANYYVVLIIAQYGNLVY